MEDIIFYCFSTVAVISALCVITAVNPVHSVLFLIMVFVMSAGVLLLLNVEFLAIVYVVVYVGAIAVLFLFVVMMLNVRMAELSASAVSYLPIGFLVGLVLFMEFYYILTGDLGGMSTSGEKYVSWLDAVQQISNVEVLSEVLYTYYAYFFLLAGVVLYVAMVGAIVLTLHHKADVRRQEVYKQVGRTYSNAVARVKLSRRY